MKKLEFETSKGSFLLNEEGKGISLKEITEKKASEIVDEFLFNANDGSDYVDQEVYKNYITDEIYLTNPKESLHSLLESRGIYLYEKPYLPEELINNQEAFIADLKAEQKTFYNPYIFKIK